MHVTLHEHLHEESGKVVVVHTLQANTYLSEEIFNVQVVRQQFTSIDQPLVAHSLKETQKKEDKFNKSKFYLLFCR